MFSSKQKLNNQNELSADSHLLQIRLRRLKWIVLDAEEVLRHFNKKSEKIQITVKKLFDTLIEHIKNVEDTPEHQKHLYAIEQSVRRWNQGEKDFQEQKKQIDNLLMGCEDEGDKKATQLILDDISACYASGLEPTWVEKQHAEQQDIFEKNLDEIKKLEEDKKPSCFISYAWGIPAHEKWVHQLAKQLQRIGVEVYLDIWHNRFGSIPEFTEKLYEVDYVIVIGTPKLLEKWQDNLKIGYIVKQELQQIFDVKRKTPEKIIKLLLDSEYDKSFPRYMNNLAGDAVDFRCEKNYFPHFFNLLEKLFEYKPQKLAKIFNHKQAFHNQCTAIDKKDLQYAKSLNVAVKVIEEAALQARGQYEVQLQQEKDVQAKQEAQKASSIIAGFLSESSPKRLREKELDDPLDIKRQKKDSAENSIYQQQSLSHDLYQLRLERMQDFAKQALEAITFIGNNETISHQMLREQLRSFLQQIQTNMTTFANLLTKKQNKLLKDMHEISWKGFQQKAEEATNSLQAITQGLKEPLDEAQTALLNKMFHKVQKIYASDANLTLSDMKRFLTNKLIETKLAQLTKRIASFPSCFISYSWGPWGAVDMKHTAEVHRLARYLKLAGVNVILDIWDNQVNNIPVFTGKLFKADKVLLIGSTHLLEKWENYCSGGQSRGRTGEQYSGNVIATELTHILKRLNEKPQDQHGIILALFEGDDKTSFPKELGLPVSDTNFASADYLIPLFHLLRRIIPQAQHTVIHQLEAELAQQVQQLAEEEDKEKLLMTYQQFKQQQSCVAWDKELLIKKADDDKTPSSSSLQANSLFKEHLMDNSDSQKVGENKNVFL